MSDVFYFHACICVCVQSVLQTQMHFAAVLTSAGQSKPIRMYRAFPHMFLPTSDKEIYRLIPLFFQSEQLHDKSERFSLLCGLGSLQTRAAYALTLACLQKQSDWEITSKYHVGLNK